MMQAVYLTPTFLRRAQQRKNPFLDALETIEYGRMTLTTPEGRQYSFKGEMGGPDADWQVHDWQVFDDFIARGEFGFADAYMDGRWDSSDIEALVMFGLMNSRRLERFFYGRPLYALWLRLKTALFKNSVTGSRRNITAHYDMGNNFYQLWLDNSMTYSCALFEGDSRRPLETAQAAKYQRILRKLDARKGEHILEIGCGWGGFAEMAARRGLRVTGITLAHTQAQYARERMRRARLEDKVTIQLTDYREIKGTFDHIVSIGMFEHVGEKYWDTYFNTVRTHLKPGGKALIQCITIDDHLFERLHNVTGFIEHYIFPGGMLPSKSQFQKRLRAAGLEYEEIFSFGHDYALTLTHWLARFERQLDNIRMLGYDEKFIRLWRLYLVSCIAAFKTGRNDVMQIMLSHHAQAANNNEERAALRKAAA